MASRAKKKASNNTQNVEAVPQVQSVDQNNNKWATIHLATTIVVLILLFFMIILSPTIFAKIKLSLTGEEADSAEYSFNASSLDMMFAPIRGCTSGFRFMLEKIGCEIKSDEAYQKLINVIGPMLPANTIENVDALGVSLTVMSYVFFAVFIAMVVLCILDFKFKKKGLLSLIGSGLFFIMSLIYLIFVMTINVNTIFSSSTINASWGLWLVFFISLAYLAINIATWVNGLKGKKNENV